MFVAVALDEPPRPPQEIDGLLVLNLPSTGPLFQMAQTGPRFAVDLFIDVEVLLEDEEDLAAQRLVIGEHLFDVPGDEQELDHLSNHKFDSLVAHLEAA